MKNWLACPSPSAQVLCFAMQLPHGAIFMTIDAGTYKTLSTTFIPIPSGITGFGLIQLLTKGSITEGTKIDASGVEG